MDSQVPEQQAYSPAGQTPPESSLQPNRFPTGPFLVGLLFLIVLFIYLAVGIKYFNQNKLTVRPLPKPTAAASSTPIAPPSPTDPTAQWQTYTNPDIGYSIKYPSSIDTTKYKSSDGSFVQILLPDIQASNPAERNFRITDIPNPSSSFQEFIDTQLLPNKTNINEQAPYILRGLRGVLFAQSFPVSNTEKFSVWIQKDTTVLGFELSFNPENKVKAVEYFNNILSSFRIVP